MVLDTFTLSYFYMKVFVKRILRYGIYILSKHHGHESRHGYQSGSVSNNIVYERSIRVGYWLINHWNAGPLFLVARVIIWAVSTAIRNDCLVAAFSCSRMWVSIAIRNDCLVQNAVKHFLVAACGSHAPSLHYQWIAPRDLLNLRVIQCRVGDQIAPGVHTGLQSSQHSEVIMQFTDAYCLAHCVQQICRRLCLQERDWCFSAFLSSQ